MFALQKVFSEASPFHTVRVKQETTEIL